MSSQHHNQFRNLQLNTLDLDQQIFSPRNAILYKQSKINQFLELLHFKKQSHSLPMTDISRKPSFIANQLIQFNTIDHNVFNEKQNNLIQQKSKLQSIITKNKQAYKQAKQIEQQRIQLIQHTLDAKNAKFYQRNKKIEEINQKKIQQKIHSFQQKQVEIKQNSIQDSIRRSASLILSEEDILSNETLHSLKKLKKITQMKSKNQQQNVTQFIYLNDEKAKLKVCPININLN